MHISIVNYHASNLADDGAALKYEWMTRVPPSLPSLPDWILRADSYAWWTNGLGDRAAWFKAHPDVPDPLNAWGIACTDIA